MPPQKCTPLVSRFKAGVYTADKSISFNDCANRAGASLVKGVVVPNLETPTMEQRTIKEHGGHTSCSNKSYEVHAAKTDGVQGDKPHEKVDMSVNDVFNIEDAFQLGDIQFSSPIVLPHQSTPAVASDKSVDTSVDKSMPLDKGIVDLNIELDNHGQGNINKQGGHTTDSEQKYQVHASKPNEVPSDNNRDASAKVADTSGDNIIRPCTEKDCGTDFGLTQLNESQWRELEIKALEEVKSCGSSGVKVPPIIKAHSTDHTDLHAPADIVHRMELPPDVPDVTPQVRVRERKLSKFNRSPFVNNFGSGETSSLVDHTCSQLAKRQTFHMMHPLLHEIRIEPDIELTNEWCPWIDDKAIVKSKAGKLYPASVNNLHPSFNFGVHVVDKKEWFHILNYGSKTIKTTHMDVLFYYLRKKAKYDHDIAVRVTTTYCLFDATIRDMYNEFIKNDKQMGIVDSATLISDYICGRTLRCNTPWALVDEVLFPVKVIHRWHWILARLSLKERTIYVYDSRPDLHAYNEEIIQATEPYAIMLPLFLSSTDFFKNRPEFFSKGSAYEDKSLVKPFMLDFSIQVPSLMKCDYGVYAAVFAEYYIQYQCMPTEDDDLSGVRGRYAMYLWHYGMRKQLAGAVSDEDN